MGVLDNRCAQRVANGASLGAALGASIGKDQHCLCPLRLTPELYLKLQLPLYAELEPSSSLPHLLSHLHGIVTVGVVKCAGALYGTYEAFRYKARPTFCSRDSSFVTERALLL